MPPARVALALFAALTFLLGPPHAAAQEASSLDEPLCPTWIEELLFELLPQPRPSGRTAAKEPARRDLRGAELLGPGRHRDLRLSRLRRSAGSAAAARRRHRSRQRDACRSAVCVRSIFRPARPHRVHLRLPRLRRFRRRSLLQRPGEGLSGDPRARRRQGPPRAVRLCAVLRRRDLAGGACRCHAAGRPGPRWRAVEPAVVCLLPGLAESRRNHRACARAHAA